MFTCACVAVVGVLASLVRGQAESVDVRRSN
jgi:hypothetical protein